MTKQLFFSLVLAFTSLSSIAQTPEDQKQLILGTWQFDKFDATATTEASKKSLLEKRSQLAKALVFTFGKDGSFKCEWPGGPDFKNYTSKYRFYPKFKNLILEEKNNTESKLTVVSITSTTLTLKDNEEDVLMIFRKKE